MNVLELIEILNAEAKYLGADTSTSYGSAFASDMMSDVLAYAEHRALMITGLCNLQVLRTAEMIDCTCIIFVRGKIPTEEMLSIARDSDIHIIITELSMYNVCGILYNSGKMGGTKIVK